MAEASRRRHSEPIHRSPSPYNSSSSSSFASSTSGFSVRTPTAGFSPTRANNFGSTASSVRFSLSAVPSGGASTSRGVVQPRIQKKTCMCSPTNHPGSFRCSLHKKSGSNSGASSSHAPPNRLNARRSAMTNSLVRIEGVEGDLVKRALAALIRPSSHQQRRRNGFRPRRSRLSVMIKAEGLL